MKHSVACLCGYETPLVEDEDKVDYDMLYIHQSWCDFKPDWAKGKTVAQLTDDDIIWIDGKPQLKEDEE